jgi:alanine racemase
VNDVKRAVLTRMSQPLSALPSAAVATVDVGAIVDNWRTLARLAGPAQCGAAVKANAYGLGLEPVARALSQAGCQTFFVANLDEAKRLRGCLGAANILVLNGLPPGAGPEMLAARAFPVLGSMVEIAEWAGISGGQPGAIIQVDTGMQRLGLSMADTEALASRRDLLAASGARLLLSHYACADEPLHPLNAVQIQRFAEILPAFPGFGGTLANSSGLFLAGAPKHDLVRPGIALYGGAVVAGQPSPMRRVVTLMAPVLQIHSARSGDTVGYGATATLHRDSILAVLAWGYADGFHRRATCHRQNNDPQRQDIERAGVSLNGRFAPFVGRASMDLSVVDITDIPGVARGDLAEIIGPHRPLADYAASLGTIDYEALTSLGQRVRFSYI